MRKTKTKTKQYINKNPIEQLLGIGGGVGQAGADLAKSAINLDNWDEYLGLTDTEEKQKNHAGDLTEGQELNLKDLKKEKKEKADVEGGLDYHREIKHLGERAINQESQEIEAQLKELMVEIKKLADSSKELQAQFKEVAIEQHIVKPGKYHKSFFTWMLSMIHIARQKVEDSGAWLTAMQSKKKSREYGAMAKKHGTTFSLSNERVVATQVG
ncbi:MAG: DUF5660 domain-containing protein [bacterium]|nr:DUF5660 domain-containing protein [bacterium]